MILMSIIAHLMIGRLIVICGSSGSGRNDYERVYNAEAESDN